MQSLAENHPKRHTESEEKLILKCFQKKFMRCDWDEVYDKVITEEYHCLIYGACEKFSVNIENSSFL